MQTIGTSKEAGAGRARGGGLGLLLAFLLLGLCWAVPSNAIPLAWFGVEEFDASAAPALGRHDSGGHSAAVLHAGYERLDRNGVGSDPGGPAAAGSPTSARMLVRDRPGREPASSAPAIGSSYLARAPPRLS